MIPPIPVGLSCAATFGSHGPFSLWFGAEASRFLFFFLSQRWNGLSGARLSPKVLSCTSFDAPSLAGPLSLEVSRHLCFWVPSPRLSFPRNSGVPLPAYDCHAFLLLFCWRPRSLPFRTSVLVLPSAFFVIFIDC